MSNQEKEDSSIFDYIYQNNAWQDPESKSGTGSNLKQTEVIREAIPTLIEQFAIKSMLDAPCGDYFWMQKIKDKLMGLSVDYTGADIVSHVVELNNAKFGSAHNRFVKLDITKDTLPKVDLIFCRDCLVHLSYKDIYKALKQFKQSGSRYLLTTTFTDRGKNHDIKTGSWRPLNVMIFPFFLPQPLSVINEHCTEDGGIYTDKSLALWELKDISLWKIRLAMSLASLISSKNPA